MTIEDVSYYALGCAICSRLHGQGFSAKLMSVAEAQSRKMSARKLFPEVAEMNE